MWQGPGGGDTGRGRKDGVWEYGTAPVHIDNHRLLRTFIQKARVPGIWPVAKRAWNHKPSRGPNASQAGSATGAVGCPDPGRTFDAIPWMFWRFSVGSPPRRI